MFLNVTAMRPCRGWSNIHRYSAVSRTSVCPYLHGPRRQLHYSNTTQETDAIVNQDERSTNKQSDGHVPNLEFIQKLDEYKRYFHFPVPASKDDIVNLKVGDSITMHGFLSARRVQHSKLVFADLTGDYIPHVQIISAPSDEQGSAAVRDLRSVPLHSPVAVTGRVTKLQKDGSIQVDGSSQMPRAQRIELDLQSIQVLNPFPKDIIVSKGAQFGSESRHLQIRFSPVLRHRLLFRRDVTRLCRDILDRNGFHDIETPLLFKSTPEGAREFLVPTRKRGYAYALPQSPQQYKQLLMASGIWRYMQFARCFRDEDLRADRQPEFTQLDLEMAFSTGADVMDTVESMVREVLALLFTDRYTMKHVDGELVPVLNSPGSRAKLNPGEDERPVIFPRITYQQAMEKYGSDKPDLRIPFDIQRIDPSRLPEEFVKLITKLKDPIIEGFRLRPADAYTMGRKEAKKHFTKFLSSLAPAFRENPDGIPRLMFYNSSEATAFSNRLGDEGSAYFLSLPAFSDMADGDIIILQARRNAPFHGGSTYLGNLRTLFYNEAVAKDLLPKDNSLKFLWVTEFPMFTPDTDKDSDPGQGGLAGFSATHHPFTAPLTDADLDLLATDPLSAKADHYDLVVNGVELGGGSRRIHVAAVQEYVMRDILRMSKGKTSKFAHLIEALRAGCPPHAGFAMGFDRFVAVLSGTSSVRDVIAFPKGSKGEDPLVQSPSAMTIEQMKTYHLQLGRKPKPDIVDGEDVAAGDMSG